MQILAFVMAFLWVTCVALSVGRLALLMHRLDRLIRERFPHMDRTASCKAYFEDAEIVGLTAKDKRTWRFNIIDFSVCAILIGSIANHISG